MTPIIERVARAIASKHFIGLTFIAPDGSPHAEPPWDGFLDHARAAIEAMQEPTEEMIEAGARAAVEKLHQAIPIKLPGYQEDYLDASRVAWSAMIEGALR